MEATPGISVGGFRPEFELEGHLQPTLQKIWQEIDQRSSVLQMIYRIGCQTFAQARDKPMVTSAKLGLLVATTLAMYPLFVGFVACVVPFRFASSLDLYSSNPNVAIDASQLFGNTGHSIGYLAEGVGLMAFAIGMLVRRDYRHAKCQIIESTYHPYIDDSSRPNDERTYLHKVKRRALKEYGVYTPKLV